MSDNQSNNKRIAKNTLYLYIRMLLIMAVTLYTSRVVLQELGVTDFGIYNVVGGIVAMMGFLNSAMSNAVQRFLSFEMGKGEKGDVNHVFSTAFLAHFIIALLILAILEVAGVWYLNAYMAIPPDRLNAANWVLQCTIATTVFGVLQVPYTGIIIANEDMSIYAYISVVEVILKLLIVYLLAVGGFDRLKMYAVLVMIVGIGIMLISRIYCIRKYKEAHIRIVKDWSLLREMTSFASWNMIGEIAWALTGQGVNIILNLFFGPAVNAARGLAEQVNGAVMKFINSFQTALNPQLIKSYAADQIDNMKILLYRGTRLSFYMLFILSLPLIIEMDYVLGLWLKEVPEYTSVFCRLILITSLIACITNLLAQVARAYGKIKKYQLCVSLMLMLNFPLSYVILKLGASPEMTAVLNLAIQILLIIVRLLIIKPMINLTIIDFTKYALIPIVKVSVLSIAIPVLLYYITEPGVTQFLLILSISTICTIGVAYFFGLEKSERTMINIVIKQKLHITKNIN